MCGAVWYGGNRGDNTLVCDVLPIPSLDNNTGGNESTSLYVFLSRQTRCRRDDLATLSEERKTRAVERETSNVNVM